jgi:hypothetical protein
VNVLFLIVNPRTGYGAFYQPDLKIKGCTEAVEEVEFSSPDHVPDMNEALPCP